MKTTVEIPDALFEQARKVIRKRKVTFRAFLEESLRKNLQDQPKAPFKLRKLPFGGKTVRPSPDWKTIREEIYRGRGE